MKAPRKWTTPVNMAMKVRKCTAFSECVALSVKKDVAISERTSGDRPNIAMVVPDATPNSSGKVLDAANRDEK